MHLVSTAEFTIQSQKHSSGKASSTEVLSSIWVLTQSDEPVTSSLRHYTEELLSLCCNVHFSNLAVSLSPFHFPCWLLKSGIWTRTSNPAPPPVTRTRITLLRLICITSRLVSRKHAWLFTIHPATNLCLGDSTSLLFPTFLAPSLALLS